MTAFLAHAADPSDETAAALPFAEEVELGLGRDVATFGRAELGQPSTWIVDREEYQGFAGPFDLLSIVAEPVVTTIGDHPRCAGPPVAAPEGFEDHRRVSIQPETASSCIEWWTIDMFLVDGQVEAVTLDLFGP